MACFWPFLVNLEIFGSWWCHIAPAMGQKREAAHLLPTSMVLTTPPSFTVTLWCLWSHCYWALWRLPLLIPFVVFLVLGKLYVLPDSLFCTDLPVLEQVVQANSVHLVGTIPNVCAKLCLCLLDLFCHVDGMALWHLFLGVLLLYLFFVRVFGLFGVHLVVALNFNLFLGCWTVHVWGSHCWFFHLIFLPPHQRRSYFCGLGCLPHRTSVQVLNGGLLRCWST